MPAAFGRLCVETAVRKNKTRRKNPAAFGRLCVETHTVTFLLRVLNPAAFGRLCVETAIEKAKQDRESAQPPSGGCVLKQNSSDYPPSYPIQPPSGGCVLKHT